MEEQEPSQEDGTLESIEEQIPPVSSPSRTKLIIGVVAVFVLVVVGVVGAYFLLQPKNQPIDDVQPVVMKTVVEEVSNLETYRNEELGFEFSYPKYFDEETKTQEIHLFGNPDIEAVELGWGGINFCSQISCYILPDFISISLSSSKDMNNLEVYGGNHPGAVYENPDISDIIFENTLINGRNTIIFTSDDPEYKNFREAHILDGKYLYTIRIDNSRLFDIVISTFKFIEPQASVDTSEWNTYRNEEYGFEMSLPQDTGGLVVLERQNENNNPDFAYDAFYDFSSEAYDVLFEAQQRDVLSSFSFSLLKYRDNILLKYNSLEGGGAIEEVNLKELKNLIEVQEVGNYSATETESGYFDVDSNILALQEYEIIQDNTNDRKIRKYEIRKRGQTECIPPDLIYEFFESDYYVVFRISQDECYNTTLSHPTLDKILSTFKFIE